MNVLILFTRSQEMESRNERRRFPGPWRAERASEDCFVVRDANGFPLACVYCRDDLHKAGWSFAHGRLTSDEARRIAAGIARLPELLGFRVGFYPRGGGYKWKAAKPYHVALEDSYIRRHWDEIDATCRLNRIPFEPTGERINRDGLWCVHEFADQLHAMMFWNEFAGRWLRDDDFAYPERRDIPHMKRIRDFDKYQARGTGWR